jgi:hypothetical protein
MQGRKTRGLWKISWYHRMYDVIYECHTNQDDYNRVQLYTWPTRPLNKTVTWVQEGLICKVSKILQIVCKNVIQY